MQYPEQYPKQSSKMAQFFKRHYVLKFICKWLTILAVFGAAFGAIFDVANMFPDPANSSTPRSNTPVSVNKDDVTGWNADEAPNLYKVDGNARNLALADHVANGDIIYDTQTMGDGTVKPIQVIARLNASTLAKGQSERKDISNEPVYGWPHNEEVDVTYPTGSTYHGWFYNRSHLVGHALGGADEAKNLVTGTRGQNVGDNSGSGGIQYIENKVLDHLRTHTSDTVTYIVTPIYLDTDTIPRVVTVDAKSDDGRINEHVITYNVMPGYDINYTNGQWVKQDGTNDSDEKHDGLIQQMLQSDTSQDGKQFLKSLMGDTNKAIDRLLGTEGE